MCENEQLNKSKHALDPFEMSSDDSEDEEVGEETGKDVDDVAQDISKLNIE
jgi:hypothetical protein